jgi:hypothetical protein
MSASHALSKDELLEALRASRDEVMQIVRAMSSRRGYVHSIEARWARICRPFQPFS